LARQSLAAGCDIALYCSGEPEPTAELLATCPNITEAAAVRLAAARMMAARRRLPMDATSLVLERDRLGA